MSDFLSNLLRRHEQPKPIVRPRLPSLFESETRRDSPVTELTVEAEAPAAPAAQLPAIHTEIPVPETPATATVTRPPRHETAARQPGPFANAPTPVPSVERHIEREVAAFTPPANEPEETPAQRIAQPLTEPAQHIIERHIDHHTHQSERRVEHETVFSAHHTIEATQVRDPASVITPAPRSSVAETKAPPPFALPREERPIPREMRRRDARETPAPAAPEPTIQISIGRIEIKATEERERPPRKADKPSSVMTLDDYLKSRAKR